MMGKKKKKMLNKLIIAYFEKKPIIGIYNAFFTVNKYGGLCITSAFDMSLVAFPVFTFSLPAQIFV